MKERLLLHICCAPCAVYVHEKLSREYEVTGFFYNPNIHPAREFQFRKKELERIAVLNHWEIVIGAYDLVEWFHAVKGHEKDPERGERCSLCFYRRLKKTFEYAQANGFTVVASTLSISPYKVTRQIDAEGEKLSREFGLRFLPENFKKQNGFAMAKKMSMEMGIQHQNYCGCVFSKIEKRHKENRAPCPCSVSRAP